MPEMLVAPLVALSIAFLNPNPKAAPSERFFSGLGSHHRAVTTKSPLAQKYFDQGMAFMNGFNHAEAIRSFQAAAEADPGCAMAYWGIALANGPNINYPMVDPIHGAAALKALALAKSNQANANEEERSLIEALSKRYADPQPDDRSLLDRAYADAMRVVWHRNPKDPDVGALFAEALMDLRPWDLWSNAGAPRDITPEIESTLEQVIRLDPYHPQGLHLYVHAMEASPHPEKALTAANRLRFLQPGLGHMVHMPSHIDIRVGHWSESEAANERAIKMDAAYRKQRPQTDFYRIYMTHNYHMLVFGAMMRGESARAIRMMDEGVRIIPPTWAKQNAAFIDGFMSMPLAVRVRFGKWNQVLEAPAFPEYFPISRTLQHADRAVAFAATGKVPQARSELAEFEASAQKVPKDAQFGNNSAVKLFEVARHLTAGEIALAANQLNDSVKELKSAVQAEDNLSYDEPPDWIQPTRHTLGAVLLKGKRYSEAAEVYRRDLAIHPNNGWALFGLSNAYVGMRRTKEATVQARKFSDSWSAADFSLSSSCLCVRQP